jgi:general secretion pathway protein G
MTGRRLSEAFTLVEILIVVVILGILAAITVPNMVRATEDASRNSTLTELQKLRNHLGVYWARHSTTPGIQEGDGSWGELISGEYLMSAPMNAWVGATNGQEIVFGAAPDAVYQSDYGWIFDPASGDVWAGGFDGNDKPLPK